MKAILEFNLPEDMAEFHIATDASALRSGVEDLRNHMRGLLKHSGKTEFTVGDMEEIYGDICEMLYVKPGIS